MQPLPPEAVAGIDQRAGQCNAMIDQLVAKYLQISAAHGTAGGVGVMGAELYRTELRSLGNVVDVLAFAIARIADLKSELENK